MIARPEVRPGLIRQSGLPPLHRLVLLTLDGIARGEMPDPRTSDVATFCGVSHRTARVVLVALEEAGWVVETGRPARWSLVPLELRRPRRVG